jgi:hypothetical protein
MTREVCRLGFMPLLGGFMVEPTRFREINGYKVWNKADEQMASAAAIQVNIDEHYKRCVIALQQIAQLADTGSRVHKERFQPNGEGDGIANGWRVAEAMREIANDVVGSVSRWPLRHDYARWRR